LVCARRADSAQRARLPQFIMAAVVRRAAMRLLGGAAWARGMCSAAQRELAADLAAVVGRDHVLLGADTEPFATDWLRQYRGSPRAVVRPRTTDEVAEVLRLCNRRRVPVVPQGGNTGLVGGSVPMRDELVLSLARMTTVRHFDATSGVLEAEAG
jgi:(R)-2-hydroxyglutarate---pyruvate transhydrogenase